MTKRTGKGSTPKGGGKKRSNVAQATAPSEGERRAQRGYVRQYGESAAAIYAGLDRGDLLWVGLADRQAGIADDVVLGYADRVVGHQFKTSLDPTPFRITTLLMGADGLLAPLASAWKLLRGSIGGEKLEIHLVTNDVPSTTDNISDTGENTAQFLREWDQHRNRSLKAWRATLWAPFVDSLLSASGLEEVEFDAFMRTFHVIHGASADFAKRFALNEESRPLVEQIAKSLPTLIARSPGKDRWTRGEFLQAIGWRESATRHTHQFPVGVAVQRNALSEQALQGSINGAAAGYVALMGPPGSGKSTLLQTALESQPNLVVARYLAFLPGAGHGVGRAEAEDFLEDVSASLRGSGLPGLRFQRTSAIERRDEFSALLEQAGERFARDRVRTVIVVDGLDHVPREECPHHSFLGELPLPAAVPDGVLFVLGTQRLDLHGLPSSIQEQAGSPGRRIDIEPLPLSAVAAMADRMGLAAEVSRQEIYEAGRGHPLATHYLIQELLGADAERRSDLLSGGAFDYAGDIESVYKAAWRGIADNQDAVAVLGLLARADGPMPTELLLEVFPEATLETAWRATRHLLSDTEDGWSIFHNSFRLFVLAQPRFRLGRLDEEYSPKVYRQLADLARRADETTSQRWLEVRYRLRAGDHQQALALATPEYFRDQFVRGRPASGIRDDIRLAYSSLVVVPDATVAFNLLLASDETTRRASSLEDATEILDSLIAIGDLDAAEGFVDETGVDGYPLVDAWLDAGSRERAQALFERTEPIHDLSRDAGNLGVAGHDAELVEWAHRVVNFRDSEQILTAIERIVELMRAPDAPGLRDPDDFGYQLREIAAAAVIESAPRENIDALISQYKLDRGRSAGWLALNGAYAAFNDGEVTLGAALINFALSDPALAPGIPRGARRRAALAAARIGLHQLAVDLFSGLSAPSLSELDRDVGSGSLYESMTTAIIEHAELAGLLNASERPLPESKSKVLRPLQRFAQEVGRISARAHLDPSSISAGEVGGLAVGFLKYVSRSHAEAGEHYYLSQLDNVATIIIRRLFFAADLCGTDEVLRMVAAVDQALQESPGAAGRLEAIPKVVAEAMSRFAGDQAGAISRLDKVLDGLQGSTPTEHLNGIANVATIFARIGCVDRAAALLDQLRAESLGYSLRAKKDPQYITWRDLLKQANLADSAGRSERVGLMTRTLSGMMETEGRDAAHRIAHDVIVEAALDSPQLGYAVAQRLSKIGAIGWAGKLDAILIGTVRRSPESYAVCALAWTSLCLPFYREHFYRQYAEGDFLRVVIAAAPLPDVVSLSDQLASSIEIHAQVDVRPGLLKCISEACAQRGISSPIVNGALARVSHEPSVERKSGSTPMPFDDVDTLDKLRERLSSDLTDSEAYGAARAFTRVFRQGSFEEVRIFFESQEVIRRDSRARFDLIDRAIDEAKLDDAKQLLSGYAFNEDGGASWMWFTGAGRARYFRARLRLEGEAVHQAALKDFIAGLAAGRESAGALLPDVKDLWLLLTSRPDWPAMWTAMAGQIVSTRDWGLGAPLDTPAPMSDGEVISALFQSALAFPVSELAFHSVAGALEIESVSASGFECLVKNLLQGGDTNPAQGLLLLLLRKCEPVSDLIPHVSALAEHDDLAVSRLAETLCQRWGVTIKRSSKELPAFYSLYLPYSNDEQEALRDPRSGAPVVPRAAGWTRMFEDVVEELARGKISPEHIRERCHQLIDSWGGLERYGTDATSRLEDDLRRQDLRMPFFRPHAAVAARALRCVANELWRAGLLDDDEVPLILFKLGYGVPDPLPQIVARPSYIPRPDTRTREDSWTKGVDFDVLPIDAGPDSVLAEVYRFRVRAGLSPGKVTRVRAMNVDPGDEGNPVDVIYGLPIGILAEGAVIADGQPSPSLVRRVVRSRIPSVPEFELQLCPYWVERLGWVSTSGDGSEAVDADGRSVAKIVHWRDGGPDGDDHSEAFWGEGVVVLLTPEGRRQVEAITGPIKVGVLARREKSGRDEDCATASSIE